MITPCVRCSSRPTTLLTYDHGNAEAFLDDVQGHERAYDGLLLCAVHAGRFTAPRGWRIIDRRRDGPDLFVEGTVH